MLLLMQPALATVGASVPRDFCYGTKRSGTVASVTSFPRFLAVQVLLGCSRGQKKKKKKASARETVSPWRGAKNQGLFLVAVDSCIVRLVPAGTCVGGFSTSFTQVFKISGLGMFFACR